MPSIIQTKNKKIKFEIELLLIQLRMASSSTSTSTSQRIVMLDIEGTTTSISFVANTLFPYARREFPRFLNDHWQEPQVKEQLLALEELAKQEQKPFSTDFQATNAQQALEPVLQYIFSLMDADRKVTPLK
jgi:enolase-phosphatase E1